MSQKNPTIVQLLKYLFNYFKNNSRNVDHKVLMNNTDSKTLYKHISRLKTDFNGRTMENKNLRSYSKIENRFLFDKLDKEINLCFVLGRIVCFL